MDWLFIVALMVIGLCSGGVTGLIGASGILVVVPALTLVLGLPVHVAIGTSLGVDVIASTAVSYVYYRRGNVELKSGVGLALGAVLGAQVGSRVAAYIPGWRLGRGFGIFLMISGVGFWRRGVGWKLPLPSGTSRRVEADVTRGSHVELKRIVASFVTGFLLGIISGVFGAGGGIMFLLTLILLLKYPIHKAIGTSTLIMAVTALSGAIGYAINGYTSLTAAILVGAGAIVGGRVGAIYANKVSEKKLTKIIGSIFLILGVLMITQQLL